MHASAFGKRLSCMTSSTDSPARTASTIAVSRATMRSARSSTRAASAAGTKTTPLRSAIT